MRDVPFLREVLVRGLLLAAVSFPITGQVSGTRYEALQRALGLSDSQVQQLQQRRPAAIAIPAEARRNADSLRDRMLDHSQQATLAAIENVLKRYHAASEAIVLGLIQVRQWPGGPLCYYPVRAFASEFGLSDSQVRQFEELEQAVRGARSEKQGADARPRRDLALAILDDGQKAKLADFETALELAREAIELGLIPDPPKGELLCP